MLIITILNMFLMVVVFVITFFSWLVTEVISERFCKDGTNHYYEFLHNSKGRTGDLGFGIRDSWNINTYACKKCNHIKSIQ